ncbi:MAG: hypothetical protein JEZ09_04850 [Salinivirgaceae bacterium]|nr:hypothetical protein [Salinivirgaceae bacterium]
MTKIILATVLTICTLIDANAQVFGGSKPKEFDVQIKNLTRQMVKSFNEEGKTQIAIMEFPDVNGTVTELGKLIPEELTTKLFKTGKFQVIERQLLNKVLQEQKLGTSGLLDASSAAQIGKLLGVDAIVTGTITDRGDAIRLNARMIETDQANVFAVASVSIIREDHLITMLGKEISKPSEGSNSTSNSSSNNEVSGKALAKGSIGDIKLEIMSVKLTASKQAIVEVIFTNKSNNDIEFRPLASDLRVTKLYDNLGQEYICKNVAIGSKNNYSYLKHLLISKVPTKAAFKFEDIDPNAESISLLKIAINDKNSFAEFRKLKFSR